MPELADLRDEFEAMLLERQALITQSIRADLERFSTPTVPEVLPEETESRRRLFFWGLLFIYLHAYNRLHRDFGSPALPSSEPSDERSLEELPGRRGIELPPSDSGSLGAGVEWADETSRELSQGMEETERKRWQRVQDKIDDRQERAKRDPGLDEIRPALDAEAIAEAVEDLYGEARALRVAITETTRAISAGEHGISSRIETELGWEIWRIWQTERDDRVCPVCFPLDGKPDSFYGPRLGAPPAHINCRCWELYQANEAPGLQTSDAA